MEMILKVITVDLLFNLKAQNDCWQTRNIIILLTSLRFRQIVQNCGWVGRAVIHKLQGWPSVRIIKMPGPSCHYFKMPVFPWMYWGGSHSSPMQPPPPSCATTTINYSCGHDRSTVLVPCSGAAGATQHTHHIWFLTAHTCALQSSAYILHVITQSCTKKSCTSVCNLKFSLLEHP